MGIKSSKSSCFPVTKMALPRRSDELEDVSLLYCLLCTQPTQEERTSFPDCGHTFCVRCLLVHHRQQISCIATSEVTTSFELKNYGSVRCPVCNKGEEGISGDKLGNVPYSHKVHQLLYEVKITKDKSKRDREEKCTWCVQQSSSSRVRTHEARKKCYKCKAQLCEKCFNIHEKRYGINSKNKESVEHIVVRNNTKRVKFTCKRHSVETVYYCKSCSKLVCDKCIIERRGHLDHNIQKLHKIQENQMQTVEERQQQINRLIAGKYQQKSAITRLKIEQQKECQKVKQDIKRQAEWLIKNVQRECERLVEDLDKFCEDTETLYNNHMSYLDHTIFHLHHLQFFVQEMSVQSGMEPVILLHDADLQQHINSYENNPHITSNETQALNNLRSGPELKLNVQVVNQQVKMGEISYKKMVSAPAPQQAMPTLPPLPKAELYYRTDNMTGTNPPGGLYFIPDGTKLLVTEYNKSQIATYDLTRKARLPHVIKDSDSAFFPHKMASDGRMLYVTDDRQKCVKGFDREGNRQFKSPHLFNSPSGIALSTDMKHLVVSDILDHTITIMTKTGVTVRKFGKEGNKDKELKVPEFLMVDDQNQIVVSDRNNHRIVIWTMEGKFVKCFGRHGAEPGMLDTPMGLCCDEYGNIIVVDSGNHRVCRFSPSGVYIDTVLRFTRGATVPYGIAISTDGDIAISDKASLNIQVYKVYNYGQR